MIKNIGKVAEHLVLAELILRDLEAYSALSFRQENYDVTMIRKDQTICRIQVKATDLQNKSTNNSINNLDKEYDFLVLVVFDNSVPSYFVLTKKEVGGNSSPTNLGTMSVSERENGVHRVKGTIEKHRNQWQKLWSKSE
jgi:hypothetical protein